MRNCRPGRHRRQSEERPGVAEAKRGYQASTAGNSEAAIAEHRRVIEQYAGTSAALSSRESLGHLLVKLKRDEEALAVFEGIVLDLARRHSGSRIVQEARTRVAALHHRNNDRQAALAAYAVLLNDESRPEIAANAQLQTAGIVFEIQMRRWMAKEKLAPAVWEEVRSLCLLAGSNPAASKIEVARAALMSLETYHWQGDDGAVISAAEDFLATFEGQDLKLECSTARFFLAIALAHLERDLEALDVFWKIDSDYSDQREMWPGMFHLEISRFWIYGLLRKTGTQPTPEQLERLYAFKALHPDKAGDF
jgi:tetratricopeptide (TPR) repeat protein